MTGLLLAACAASHPTAAAIAAIAATVAVLVDTITRRRVTPLAWVVACFVIGLVTVYSWPHSAVNAWRPYPNATLLTQPFAVQAFAIYLQVGLASALCLSMHRRGLLTDGFLRPTLVLGVVSIALVVNPFGDYGRFLDRSVDRMVLWAVLLLPLLTAHVLWGTAQVSPRIRPWLYSWIACVVLASGNGAPPPGLSESFLSHRASLASVVAAHLPKRPASSLVIADHGNQFLITAATGIPAVSRLPEHPERYERIVWLIRVPPELGGDSFTTQCSQVTSLFQLCDGEPLSRWLRSSDRARIQQLLKANSLHSALLRFASSLHGDSTLRGASYAGT
jgi:hypothetical protein